MCLSYFPSFVFRIISFCIHTPTSQMLWKKMRYRNFIMCIRGTNLGLSTEWVVSCCVFFFQRERFYRYKVSLSSVNRIREHGRNTSILNVRQLGRGKILWYYTILYVKWHNFRLPILILLLKWLFLLSIWCTNPKIIRKFGIFFYLPAKYLIIY